MLTVTLFAWDFQNGCYCHGNCKNVKTLKNSLQLLKITDKHVVMNIHDLIYVHWLFKKNQNGFFLVTMWKGCHSVYLIFFSC